MHHELGVSTLVFGIEYTLHVKYNKIIDQYQYSSGKTYFIYSSKRHKWLLRTAGIDLFTVSTVLPLKNTHVENKCTQCCIDIIRRSAEGGSVRTPLACHLLSPVKPPLHGNTKTPHAH